MITLIRQEYESIEGRQDYRMWSGIIYRGREVSMDIRKTKDKNDKNRKLKYQYLNYNLYRYIVKDCRKPKKEKEIRKCYKYNKVGYLIKTIG